MLIAFVDAESDFGAGLLKSIESEIRIVPEATVALWRRRLGDAIALNGGRVERWVRNDLLAEREAAKMHPGVRRALRVVRNEIASRDDLSLERMAAVAKLSPSRFMHVFTESVGVPLRPYIRWLRLQIACSEMTRGAKVADAAHRAGFADAAHLTRTLRQMMGMTPGELVGRRSPARVALPADK